MAAVFDKIYPLLGVVLLVWLMYLAAVACWELIVEVCDTYRNVND